MTPDQAEETVQYIADQQGQFAAGLLRASNQLEQLETAIRRVETTLARLTVNVERLDSDSRTGLQTIAEAQHGLERQLAAIRSLAETAAGRAA